MSGHDSGAPRRRVVQSRGRSCQVVTQANIVTLPKGPDGSGRPPRSCVDTPTNPAALLREAAQAIAGMATPEVPAVWCLATYAALVERLGTDRIEALVVALRDECASLRIDLSAGSHASDAIKRRAHYLASAARLLGFERLARQSMALQPGLEGSQTTGCLTYFDRALAVATDAIDAHFALAAA